MLSITGNQLLQYQCQLIQQLGGRGRKGQMDDDTRQLDTLRAKRRDPNPEEGRRSQGQRCQQAGTDDAAATATEGCAVEHCGSGGSRLGVLPSTTPTNLLGILIFISFVNYGVFNLHCAPTS